MIPLVSAIMPTRGRQRLARIAIDCFLSQTYANRELIILDDSDDPSFASDITIDGVHRKELPKRESIASKRNQCCEMACGEIIIHWDSDDWSAPFRIADQVRRLRESGLAVTGYNALLFHREDGHLFRYRGMETYGLGTSLCYLKSWWKANPFQNTPRTSEDNLFVTAAQRAKQIINADAGPLMVARIHAGNTSAKPTHGAQYRQVSIDQLPPGFVQ